MYSSPAHQRNSSSTSQYSYNNSSSRRLSRGSPSGGKIGSPSPRKEVNQGPVKEFATIIEESKPEDWQKRCKALRELIESIPPDDARHRAGADAWYNSPAALRNLSNPFSDLLKDARSAVVKRACADISNLFTICQANARLLLKDMMPTVLAVHAQTVQVIRNYVQTMIEDAIPLVPCKMAMPIWLDRLKVEKSRTVRDACVYYLGLGLQYWNEPGYLSDENLMQVGTALIKTLRDPSPSVRKNARTGLEVMRNLYPILWDKLVRDPDGPAARDRKLQQWLLKVTEEVDNNGMQDAAEDYSVASRYSNFTMNTTRSKTPTNRSVAGKQPPPSLLGPHQSQKMQRRPSSSSLSATGNAIPTAIHVSSSSSIGGGSKPQKTGRGLGPPVRRQIPAPKSHYSTPPSPARNEQQHTHRENTPQPGRPPMNLTIKTKYNDNDNQNNIASNTNMTGQHTPSPLHTSMGSTTNNVRQQQQQQAFSSPPLPNLPTNHTKNVVDHDPLLSSPPPVEQQRKRAPTPERKRPPTPEIYMDPTSGEDDDPVAVSSPFLTSMQELRDHAAATTSSIGKEKQQQQEIYNNKSSEEKYNNINDKSTNSSSARRSIMLKQRLRTSLLGGGLVTTGSNDTPLRSTNDTPATMITVAPSSSIDTDDSNNKYQQHSYDDENSSLEHISIAQQLLKAHKDHVDTIMETLKNEMDALRNFELAFKGNSMPTEEQVLDYFESVGTCLDKRTAAGNLLLNEMDMISQGGSTIGVVPANGSGDVHGIVNLVGME